MDPVTEYAQRVVAGEYFTGKLERLACERHLRDLEKSKERGMEWRPASAGRVLAWFEAFCVHFEGPKAGQSVELAPWQKFAIGSVFGWYRWDEEQQVWLRRFRRVFWEVAKKNGKSLIAGGLAVYLAFFDGEAGAQVYAAATKRAQAQLVWGAGKVMVQKSPALRARIHVRALSLFDPKTNSKFAPLGKDTKTEDGINPYAVIVDEVHRMEDRSLLDLLTNSMGARVNPIVWMITTAGTTGPSIWGEEHDYAARVLEGLLDDDGLFAYVCNLDEGDDPFDEVNWPKANPNLGVSVMRADMRDRAREAQVKPGARNDFLRLRLNLRTQSVQRWMDPALWKSNGEPPGERAHRIAYAGLDLGSRIDLSALVILVPAEDDMLDVYCHFWCPREGILERSRRDRVPYDRWAEAGLIHATDGEVTDYEVIRADFEAILEDLDLYEIGYDQHDATQLVTQLLADGFRMVRIMQSSAQMDTAVTECERLLAAKRLRHGNHPVLAWMVDNAVMVQDAAGRRKPDKLKSRERIDGVPAMLMGLKRYMANAGSEVTWTAA